MKTNIVNKEFSDLCAANLSDSSWIYKASTSWLPSGDFIQTGFDWFPDKLKFSDSLKIEDLDQESSELVGKSISDLEKTELTLFPTLSRNEGMDNKFFGSFLDKSWEIFGFKFNEGIEWVKLYEDENDSDYSALIEFEGSEVGSEKIIILLVSPDEETQSIKVSYSLWLSDNNGNYKMKDYVLRNDSFHNSEPLEIKNEDIGFLYSSISGSLLGTKKIDSHPIFDFRDSIKSGSKIWNKDRVYGVGEKVILKKGSTKIYESIIPDNLGNHPCFSSTWIESGFIEKCLNRTAQVIVDYEISPGTISPYGIINYPYNITEPSVLYSKTFDYTENTGYKLQGVSIDGENLVDSDGYYINTTSNKIVVNKSVFTSITNSRYLYFLFSKIIGKIAINAIETGEDTSYIELENLVERSDWKNIITDPSVLVREIKYKDTGEEISIEDAFNPETETGIELGKSIEIQEKYVGNTELKLARIVVKYIEDKTEKLKELIDYTIEPDGTIMINDTFNYSTNIDGGDVLYPQYYVYYDPKLYKILIYSSSGIEVSSDSVVVESGSSYDLFFYTTISGTPVVEVEGGSSIVTEITPGNYKVSLSNIRNNIKVNIYVNQ